MDELFARLITITQEAAAKASALTEDEIESLMSERMKLILEIRKLDARIPDGSPERLRYRDSVAQLQYWDGAILRRMQELKLEASEYLGRISDYHKQKDAYDGDDVDNEGYFVDTKR